MQNYQPGLYKNYDPLFCQDFVTGASLKKGNLK